MQHLILALTILFSSAIIAQTENEKNLTLENH
jgi:hypothetical protein